MKSIDESWAFLKDFYHSDSLIVSLINKAIGFRSNKTLRDDCFESFMEDLLSLLPNHVSGKTYFDFLNYVKPYKKDYEEYNVDTIDIFYHENAFLNYNWFENFIDETFGIVKSLSVASVFAIRSIKGSMTDFILKKLESFDNENKSFLQRLYYALNTLFKSGIIKSVKTTNQKIIEFPTTVNSMPNQYKPYIILQAFGLAQDWFLYGHDSKDFIDDIIEAYFRFLRQQRFKKKKKQPELKSAEQLYPLMTLLIVLRREWEYSSSGDYISYKYNSLKIPSDELNDALIYGLYREYDKADPAIILNPNVPQVKFHPLVASRIIKYGTYKVLFEYKFKENRGDMVEPKDAFYKYTEEILDKKEIKEKRLLLDYLFPYTIIRENDVFLPNGSITDQVYISLIKGSDYHKFWRKPKDDDNHVEKFDIIQIEPMRNMSNEYDDNRVIGYRKYLAPSGKYLVVQSRKEYELHDRLVTAFADFRHDLKPLMTGANIITLQQDFELLDEVGKKLNRLIEDVESYTNHSDDTNVLTSLRLTLRSLDNDMSLKKIPNPKIVKVIDTVRNLRDIAEQSGDTRLQESLSHQIMQLKQLWADICIENITYSKNQINSIKETHEILFDCINLAGTEINFDNNDDSKVTFKIVDFLKGYGPRYNSLNTSKIVFKIDDSSIEKDYTIRYNKAILYIILNSIVDNAKKHGFQNYDCETPTIAFVLDDNDSELLIKICNNGRPIDITNDDFKTRGVFAGQTGNTGIGGFQINKYAESQGGRVEIPLEKEWNTEIHLYIKKF